MLHPARSGLGASVSMSQKRRAEFDNMDCMLTYDTQCVAQRLTKAHDLTCDVASLLFEPLDTKQVAVSQCEILHKLDNSCPQLPWLIKCISPVTIRLGVAAIRTLDLNMQVSLVKQKVVFIHICMTSSWID